MRMRKWLALALSAVLLFAAGCQAVQGVDLSGVLKQSLQTTSMEGSISYELKIDVSKEILDEAANDAEEAALFLAMLTDVKLKLDEIKVQDAWNASVRGALALGDIEIGFKLQQADALYVLELDGASQPIVMDLAVDEAFVPGMTNVPQAQMQEFVMKLFGSAGDYVVDNMPNMSDLSVALNTPVTVGGEELSLARISLQFDGADLLEWLKSYLDALIQDEEGARNMIQSVFTVISEQSDLFTAVGLPMDDAELGELTEENIAEIADELIAQLKAAAAGLAYLEVAQPETVETLFSDAIQVQADVYVDSKLHVRKQDVDVRFRPDGSKLESTLGYNPFEWLEGIRLAVSSELWNINGDIELEPPRFAEGEAVTAEEMDEWNTVRAARFFDRDSSLYELLFNRLKLGEQELWLYPEFDNIAPIVTPNGWTLVPLRYTAEHFEAEIVYDPETKQLLLLDEATGTEIAFTVGSKFVTVNGETVEWSYPVTVMADGAAYVPGRNLMETLGGKIEWDYKFGSRVLIMTRDIAELAGR